MIFVLVRAGMDCCQCCCECPIEVIKYLTPFITGMQEFPEASEVGSSRRRIGWHVCQFLADQNRLIENRKGAGSSVFLVQQTFHIFQNGHLFGWLCCQIKVALTNSECVV